MSRRLVSPISMGVIPITPQAAYVYRAYDKSDDLLYIGVTDHLEQRLAAHRRGSSWFPYARRIEWEQYADRATANAAESRQIRELCPQHNTTDNAGRLIAAAMGHRRPYPSTAWKRLGEVIREQRTRQRRSQKSVAWDCEFSAAVLQELETGETTRYQRVELEGLEYGMGWLCGSVERVLQGGLPEHLTPEMRLQRAHREADRVSVMGGI